jgi:hypothetical protein
MAQWHALGRAGGAGGVEQRGWVVRFDPRRFYPRRFYRLVGDQTSPAPLVSSGCVQQDGPRWGLRIETLQPVGLVGGGEDELGAAVLENTAEHLIAELCVQGYGHGPGFDHRQASRDPLWAIAGQQCHVVAAVDAGSEQTARQPSRVIGELGEGPALDVFLAQREYGRSVAVFGKRIDKCS